MQFLEMGIKANFWDRQKLLLNFSSFYRHHFKSEINNTGESPGSLQPQFLFSGCIKYFRYLAICQQGSPAEDSLNDTPGINQYNPMFYVTPQSDVKSTCQGLTSAVIKKKKQQKQTPPANNQKN